MKIKQMRKGVDSLRNLTDRIADLKADGVTFVGRYYYWGSCNMDILRRAEAEAYSAAGLKVVSMFGGCTLGPDLGRRLGQQDGIDFWYHADKCGQPMDTAAYFKVDPGTTDLGRLASYFVGIRDILGSCFRIGAIGSGDALTYLEID